MRLADDISFALRALRRRPGIVIGVVATLALSIGANTAVFSLIDAVILHPLVVADPDRLVAIYTASPQRPYGGSTLAMYRELAAHTSTLAGVGAYWTTTLPSREGDGSQDLRVALVTDNYFSLLGVRAAIGRTMLPGDPRRPGENPVAVVSSAFWRRHFGAQTTAIGSQIDLHGQRLTVIGVTPGRFRGTDLTAVPDLWVPISMVPLLKLDMVSQPGGVNPDLAIFQLFARLAPHVNGRRAQAESAMLARHIDVSSPFAGMRPGISPSISFLPLDEAAASARDRPTLLRFIHLLVGVVVLTLLLACMNVANLLVVRARERSHELGVRVALGASSWRLAQHLFAEGLVLAGAGGAAGIIVAVGTLRFLSAFTLPGQIALDRLDIGLNSRVLAFTCAMSILTAFAVGLAPVIRTSRIGVMDVLRSRVGDPSAGRQRQALLVTQVAMSIVLLVGAALLLRSIQAGMNTSLGFDPRPLAAASVANKMADSGGVPEYEAVVAQLKQLPGVSDAAAATHVPLAHVSARAFGTGPASDTMAPAARTVLMGVNHIAGDYFGVLGDPVVMGRPFTDQDGPAGPRVVILNESGARALWPHESPIGKLVHGRWFLSIWFTYTVVGVVRDTKYSSLQDRGVPFAYVPMTQEDFSVPVSFVVRSDHPRAVLAMLQSTVAAVAPDLKPPAAAELRPRLVSDQLDVILAPQRFGAALVSGFALLALCVSAVGIYGTVAYAAVQRRKEIAVRIALGARAVNVLSLVLFETAAAITVGTGLGLVGAVLTTGLLDRFLYDVAPTDPISFVVATAVMTGAAAAATLVPLWHAIRIDPVQAIRTEQ